MIIDFNQIEEVRIDGFKGGRGELLTRNFVDACNKIMYSILVLRRAFIHTCVTQRLSTLSAVLQHFITMIM